MNDGLKEQLQSWRVEPEIPVGFQREVWQRIAARRSREWSFSDFFQMFARPRFAMAVVFSAMLLGAGAAQVGAMAQNRSEWQALGAAYVRSVNPVEMASTRPQ